MGHWEPRNEVGSKSPAEHLVWFEWKTFRFSLRRFNPPGHYPPPNQGTSGLKRVYIHAAKEFLKESGGY